ncbi:MAG: hypothetical protein KDD28_15505 [Phaeodactylibacter sp.]|nr:hypothetical protein [Phaeodactylibacter sp.]
MDTKPKMEDFNKMVSTWLTPILLGVVGFFTMGILNDVKEIKASQILFMKEQATMHAKIENLDRRVDGHEKWLDEIDKNLREHERESARSKR